MPTQGPVKPDPIDRGCKAKETDSSLPARQSSRTDGLGAPVGASGIPLPDFF